MANRRGFFVGVFVIVKCKKVRITKKIKTCDGGHEFHIFHSKKFCEQCGGEIKESEKTYLGYKRCLDFNDSELDEAMSNELDEITPYGIYGTNTQIIKDNSGYGLASGDQWELKEDFQVITQEAIDSLIDGFKSKNQELLDIIEAREDVESIEITFGYCPDCEY